jgi:hypothetical protein
MRPFLKADNVRMDSADERSCPKHRVLADQKIISVPAHQSQMNSIIFPTLAE